MKQPNREWVLIGVASIACAAAAWWMPGFYDRKPAHPKMAIAKPDATLPLASQRPSSPAIEINDEQTAPVIGRAVDPAALKLAEVAAARLREWEDQDDLDLRETRMRELEELLHNAEMPAILERLPSELVSFALGLPPFQRWIKDRPQVAAAWMSAHTDAIATVQVRQLAASWQTADPTGLRGYVLALADGVWKQEMIAVLSAQAAEADPREALDWAAQMQQGGRQTGALEAAASAWVKQDPEAARAWVGQLRDRALRERLTGQLAAEAAESDPAFAARWAVQSMHPGNGLDRALANIASSWAEKEPAAASEWVTQFPAGSGRRMAMDGVVNAWGNLNRPAAAAWIESLPEETARKRAAALLATLPTTEQP